MKNLDIKECFSFTNEGTYEIKPYLVSQGITEDIIENSSCCECVICNLNKKNMYIISRREIQKKEEEKEHKIVHLNIGLSIRFLQLVDLLSGSTKNFACDIKMGEMAAFINKSPIFLAVYRKNKIGPGGYLQKITNKKVLRITEMMKLIIKLFRKRKKLQIGTTLTVSCGGQSLIQKNNDLKENSDVALIRRTDGNFK